MSENSRFYILGAFVLGVALTTAYTRQSLQEKDEASSRELKQHQKLISKFAKLNDLDILKKSLAAIETSLEKGAGNIKEGIEGSIGDTPLIKIKSLSEYTGCDILVKAEVCNVLVKVGSGSNLLASSSMELATAQKIESRSAS